MITSELNRIERSTLIHARRARVWSALTTSEGFSNWFSVEMADSFAPGKRVDMVSTEHSSKGQPFYVIIERMEPEHTFSWRWHPGSASPSDDGTTRVEFHLEEVQDGTLVTVRETGFDRISLARRAKAFAENERGWEMQLESLRQYAGHAA
jgi:uncharacterized protein YndB with AHSA1/START domain